MTRGKVFSVYYSYVCSYSYHIVLCVSLTKHYLGTGSTSSRFNLLRNRTNERRALFLLNLSNAKIVGNVFVEVGRKFGKLRRSKKTVVRHGGSWSRKGSFSAGSWIDPERPRVWTMIVGGRRISLISKDLPLVQRSRRGRFPISNKVQLRSRFVRMFRSDTI